MRQYLNIFFNWRIDALLILAIMAFILIFSECDVLSILIATKAAGFALAYAVYKLHQYWDNQGLVNELDIFSEQ